jgi:hypothetical protein
MPTYPVKVTRGLLYTIAIYANYVPYLCILCMYSQASKIQFRGYTWMFFSQYRLYTSIIKDNYHFYLFFADFRQIGEGPIIFRASSFLIPLLCLWNWAWTEKSAKHISIMHGTGGEVIVQPVLKICRTFCQKIRETLKSVRAIFDVFCRYWSIPGEYMWCM